MLSMTRFVLLTLLVAVATIAGAIKVKDGIIYNSAGLRKNSTTNFVKNILETLREIIFV